MHARRIRISFSDPDATESDSGDDASSSGTAARNMKAAAGKTEIVILVGKMVLASSGTGNPAGRGSKAQAAGPLAAASSRKHNAKPARPAPTKRRYRGVYERQPGRWAAEFRSHRLKVRHWLRTFPTEKEAKAAYDAFEAQFLSLPRGGPPGPVRGDDGGDVTDVHSASLRPRDEKKQIVQALTSNTTMPTTESSARAVSPSSTPCLSSLTTASTSPAASQNARPLADAPSSLLYPFREDEPTEEDLIGLADLADLPLPSLDGNLDFDLGDLALFDGFL